MWLSGFSSNIYRKAKVLPEDKSKEVLQVRMATHPNCSNASTHLHLSVTASENLMDDTASASFDFYSSHSQFSIFDLALRGSLRFYFM